MKSHVPVICKQFKILPASHDQNQGHNLEHFDIHKGLSKIHVGEHTSVVVIHRLYVFSLLE